MSGAILVTGATGNVGREVVAELLRAGLSVRAAVPGRGVEMARERWGGAVEVVRFEFEAPDTFATAFEAVNGVFLMRPPHIAAVKRIMGPAIRHATGDGRPHVVVLSVLGAGNNPLVPHHAMEKLVERSGLPYTLLRPSFFMRNLSTQYLEDIGTRGEIHVPAGRGKTSFIDVRDIAAVAARVMGRPEHFGRAYTLTGGEALDYFAVARVLTAVLGRSVRYANPSPREFRTRLREQGTAEDFVRVLRGIYFTARIGLAARVTPDVELLLGRPPISLDRFVRDHAVVWQNAAEPPLATTGLPFTARTAETTMSPTDLDHDRSLAPVRGSRPLGQTGLVAGVLAAVANAAVFALAVARGIFPSLTFQPDVGAQMSVEPVLLVSVVGVLAGVGAFALLWRRLARPVPVFLRVAGVVLLLSFAAPFVIPGTALMQAIVLNVMHVVVASLVVWTVLRTQAA